MKKYLIDKTGVHELQKGKKGKSTKKYLRNYKYLGKSILIKSGEKEKIKVYCNSK